MATIDQARAAQEEALKLDIPGLQGIGITKVDGEYAVGINLSSPTDFKIPKKIKGVQVVTKIVGKIVKQRAVKAPRKPRLEHRVGSGYVPVELDLKCIRCDKLLEADDHVPNAASYPIVYGGVVLRSNGNYGSTVLDCGVGIPRGFEDEIQIILCDECIKKNAERINVMTEKREVKVHYASAPSRLQQWSDYSTFAEMDRIARLPTENPYAKFKPLGMAAELENAKKAGDTAKVKELTDNHAQLLKGLDATLAEINKKTPAQHKAEDRKRATEFKKQQKIAAKRQKELMKRYGPKVVAKQKRS